MDKTAPRVLLPAVHRSQQQQPSSRCPLPVRHLILACALISFTLLCANTTAFSVAVICMSQAGATTNGTETASDRRPRYPFSVSEQNAFFSAAALGSIISGLAITALIERFGLRRVLCAHGFISSLCCFLLPLAASQGFLPLFALRMVQGSSGPAQYVMIGAIARDWAPLQSIGAYLMVLSAHFQFGRVLSMPLAASFCSSPSLGWPSLYFLLGTSSAVAFTVFYLLFRDHPKQHPLVGEQELQKICRGKRQSGHPCEEVVLTSSGEEQRSKEEGLKVPYRAILGDCVVWVVLLTYWSDEVGFETLGQFGPIYLNRVLSVDIRYTGALSALPYGLSIGVKVLAGAVHRRLPCSGERTRIYLFTAFSQLGMGSCFLVLALLPSLPGLPLWPVQVAYTAVNIFCGLDFLGVVRCSQRISQQHAHVLMAWNSIISAATVLLLPLVVTVFAPQNSVAEWSRLFAGIGSLELLMVTLFFATCNTEPRKWTQRKGIIAAEGKAKEGALL